MVYFIKNISHSTLSDKELVSLYKKTEDLAVLGELYQRYMDLVFGVCLKYLKETETSRDAVMQIFEELINKLKKHEVDNFRGWLHQLARNYCLMQLRTPKNLKIVEMKADFVQSDELLHLDGMMEKEENFKRLDYCLGQLNNDQQVAVRLFYLENKCYKEIADVTGQEWNHVRSFIQNGRRNLKLCMESKETRMSLGE